MTIIVDNPTAIPYRYLEDRDIATWQYEEATRIARIYGDTLETITSGHLIEICADTVDIRLPLEVDPLPVAKAAVRALRDGRDYRRNKPCEWHINNIRYRRSCRQDTDQNIVISIHCHTNPGPTYSEEDNQLKKRISF